MSEIQAVKAFVESIDLGLPSATSRSSNLENDVIPDSLAYVVGGSIISFTVGTSDPDPKSDRAEWSEQEDTPIQQKKDAILWLLFGQLAADAKFDRFSSFDDWYSTYVKTLGQIGMVISGSKFTSTEFKGVIKNFMLDQLKTEILPDQYQIIVAGLKSLETAGLTGEATTILGRATGRPHAGFNQVHVCKVDSHLNISLCSRVALFSGLVIANIFSPVTQTFVFASPDTYVTYTTFVNIPQTVEIRKGTSNATLAKALADAIRDRIPPGVLDRMADYVRPIILNPEVINSAEN